MNISEIFYSIQGEGKNIGIPVIFVRLAGCNLRCTWCDTKYAYEGHHKSLEEMIKRIKDIQDEEENKCRHIVFTGGEPMLQQLEMYALIEALRERSIASYFEIETNGTIVPSSKKHCLINQWNVSPKQEYDKVVTAWNDVRGNIFFKFVIDSKETLKQLESIKCHTRHHVGFMPEGQTKKELEKSSKWVIEECKRLGIRFCPRLHIQIWDKKRGV